MKAKDYRKMNEVELKKELMKLKVELIKARGSMGAARIGKQKQKSSTAVGDDMQKRIRKEIARILTIFNERRKEIGK